jgi:hypothetical protein
MLVIKLVGVHVLDQLTPVKEVLRNLAALSLQPSDDQRDLLDAASALATLDLYLILVCQATG